MTLSVLTFSRCAIFWVWTQLLQNFAFVFAHLSIFSHVFAHILHIYSKLKLCQSSFSKRNTTLVSLSRHAWLAPRPGAPDRTDYLKTSFYNVNIYCRCPVGHFWYAELALWDEPNAGLKCQPPHIRPVQDF